MSGQESTVGTAGSRSPRGQFSAQTVCDFKIEFRAEIFFNHTIICYCISCWLIGNVSDLGIRKFNFKKLLCPTANEGTCVRNGSRWFHGLFSNFWHIKSSESARRRACFCNITKACGPPGANCQSQYRYVQRLRSTGLCNIPQSDADKRSAAPNFAPFRQKSLGDCSRPLLPTQGWLTSLTKNGHVPNGLMDIQHPAVLDDHPVVSALSQLSTCHQEKTFEKFIPYGMSSYPVQKWYNFIPKN